MFYVRYWFYHPVVRGVATAAIILAVAGLSALFIWWFWPREEPPRLRYPIPGQSEYLTENLGADCIAILGAPVADDPFPKLTEECADKVAAQKNNHATLQQSIRSANAAESSAFLTYLQTCIGIIGAILVTASLFLSANATIAASKAAKGAIDAAVAARESTELSRRDFSMTHRPRLRVRKVLVPALIPSEPIEVQVEIANIGNTNTAVRQAAINVQVGRAPRGSFPPDQPEPEYFGAGSSSHGDRIVIYPISAGGHLVMKIKTSLLYVAESRFDPKHMVVRGSIHYSDSYVGNKYDIRARQEFESVDRKTEFERFCTRRDHPSGIVRFAKAEKPDPDYEYED